MQEKGTDKKHYPKISWEYAQEEIATKAGVNIDHAGSSDVALLQEDLIDVMPAVEEANSISEELDKRVKFEIILISPQMLGKMQGKCEVGQATNTAVMQAHLIPKIYYYVYMDARKVAKFNVATFNPPPFPHRDLRTIT